MVGEQRPVAEIRPEILHLVRRHGSVAIAGDHIGIAAQEDRSVGHPMDGTVFAQGVIDRERIVQILGRQGVDIEGQRGFAGCRFHRSLSCLSHQYIPRPWHGAVFIDGLIRDREVRITECAGRNSDHVRQTRRIPEDRRTAVRAEMKVDAKAAVRVRSKTRFSPDVRMFSLRKKLRYRKRCRSGVGSRCNGRARPSPAHPCSGLTVDRRHRWLRVRWS